MSLLLQNNTIKRNFADEAENICIDSVKTCSGVTTEKKTP
jgi:hypothetical protein